jgi:N,N-dimethylformamidase
MSDQADDDGIFSKSKPGVLIPPQGDPVAIEREKERILSTLQLSPSVLVGYTDRLSVAPGDTVSFKVSSRTSKYYARIVRLIHGDINPEGPGFKEEPIATEIEREYPGREQTIEIGSYVSILDENSHLMLHDFSLQCWIYPTRPGGKIQGLMTKWADLGGFGLFIEAEGDLAFWVGTESHLNKVRTEQALRGNEWYFVASTYQADTGTTRLYQEPVKIWPHEDSFVRLEKKGGPISAARTDVPFRIAAYSRRADSEPYPATGHFSGKVDRPRVFGGVLTQTDIESLRNGGAPTAVSASLVAEWDLGADHRSDSVPDISGNGLTGEVVNMPTRAVTGYNWSGAEVDYRTEPDEYRAIHFHDDDLEDAGWETDFSLTVHPDMRSGIYAAHLTSNDQEDYVPFFVRSAADKPTADILLLMPTMSYLAYANEHVTWMSIGAPPPYEDIELNLEPGDHYAIRHKLLSLYDTHSDGSGVCYSSRRRPLMNMRPKYRMALLRGPHQFPADLHLVDWLEEKGFIFDIATDEDLNAEGIELLQPYSAVLTGSHPEYCAGAMLDALERYAARGGSIMYLGGNGFYWVTSIDPVRPHVIEVRRGYVGTASWRSAPGEGYSSNTGEIGGLWRYRGRSPQSVTGVGYTATGYSPEIHPYHRMPDSFDPRASFIFEGIGEDEPIGGFGLVLGTAAGFEVDRFDRSMGTPPHALLVAQATSFSDTYQGASEEVLISDSRQGGTVNPLVRADMVYYEYQNRGAVFSVGSITWCGSLSYNNYRNNVSRVTENVLRHFITK